MNFEQARNNNVSARCTHEDDNLKTDWNDDYIEHREHSTVPRGVGWDMVGIVTCENCGKVWHVYQAPGIFD